MVKFPESRRQGRPTRAGTIVEARAMTTEETGTKDKKLVWRELKSWKKSGHPKKCLRQSVRKIPWLLPTFQPPVPHKHLPLPKPAWKLESLGNANKHRSAEIDSRSKKQILYLLS